MEKTEVTTIKVNILIRYYDTVLKKYFDPGDTVETTEARAKLLKERGIAK